MPPIAVTDRLHFPTMEPVRIGMPELCLTGLSETWLFKACGHRHWLALARAHGQEQLTFRNLAGERLYPAFTSVTIEQARLDHACEDDILTFEVTLGRTGRTRYHSHIIVRSGGVQVAVVLMETIFIRREIVGQNRGVARSVVARPCSLLPSASLPRLDPGADLCEKSDFTQGDRETIVLIPSPHEDFNGAGFLYFAAFQAMVDRAEWQWFRPVKPVLQTGFRQIRYLGNVEPGENVQAKLIRTRHDETGLAHLVSLHRATDDFEIARCHTWRKPCIDPTVGTGN